MKSKTANRTALGLTALSVAVLSACGGGGGSGGSSDQYVEGTDIPTSATTSSAGAFSFVNGVAGSTDNTAEPLRVGNATLATSDTDEPSAL
jgi:hypothetical protein